MTIETAATIQTPVEGLALRQTKITCDKLKNIHENRTNIDKEIMITYVGIESNVSGQTWFVLEVTSEGSEGTCSEPALPQYLHTLSLNQRV